MKSKCFVCIAIHKDDPTKPINDGVRDIKLQIRNMPWEVEGHLFTPAKGHLCEEHSKLVPKDQEFVEVHHLEDPLGAFQK